MNISKDELKKIKIKIFEKYISKEEKDKLEKLINDDITISLNELTKESEPIDE